MHSSTAQAQVACSPGCYHQQPFNRVILHPIFPPGSVAMQRQCATVTQRQSDTVMQHNPPPQEPSSSDRTLRHPHEWQGGRPINGICTRTSPMQAISVQFRTSASRNLLYQYSIRRESTNMAILNRPSLPDSEPCLVLFVHAGLR